ncbi:MAG: HDOD domain-containing protein [Magnetococcus sp. DMHC-6]
MFCITNSLSNGTMVQKKMELIRMVDKMPAFPQSVHRVLQLTADINCAPKELVEVITHDPVLTLKILSLLNSPYFGLSRSISSIQQAVVFVGINTIKNLALSIAPMGILPQHIRSDHYMSQLLLHSLATATCTKQLCRRLGISEIESTNYFVGGLLHDFGKVVLARFQNKNFKQALRLAEHKKISLLLAERKILGTTHTQVGSQLGKKWCLPKELVACLRDHHTPDKKNTRYLMVDCVFAANQLVKKLGIGHAGNPIIENLPPRIADRFGMDLTDLAKSASDFADELKKASVFIHI